jgi:hypothetical protein
MILDVTVVMILPDEVAHRRLCRSSGCLTSHSSGNFPEISLAWQRILTSVRAVTPVARLLALWLAALWLPLTMHCQLASLKSCDEGISCCGAVLDCDDTACCGEGCACQPGVCKIIESGNYFLQKSPLQVSFDAIESPGLSACRRVLPPLAIILNEATGAPPGFCRIWQFVLRAAPAPRAPSAVC